MTVVTVVPVPFTLGGVVRPSHLPITHFGGGTGRRTVATMGDRWLPYSAAALASGAVALVLGTLGLPTGTDEQAILQTAQLEQGRWIMSSAAFFLCSVGLTLGLPTFLFVLPRRGRRFGVVGTVVFGVATMSMAAYGALLAFFQSLVADGIIVLDDMARLGDDPGLTGFTIIFVGSFYLGETLIAIGMLRARTVPRWVPTLFLLHVAMLPFVDRVPALQGIGAVMVGVAFMGVAVFANERFQIDRAAAFA